MDRATGRRITGLQHLRQSVADILTTPLGSRLQRRSYGSLLPSLIDQPDNPATRLRLYSATVAALMRWEPRLRITRVQIAAGDAPGRVVLDLAAEDTGTGRAVGMSLPLQLRGAA